MREADRRLPARIEEQRRPFLGQADDDAADQRAIGVADAAEDRRREQAEKQRQAEIRIERADRRCVEDAGKSGQEPGHRAK